MAFANAAAVVSIVWYFGCAILFTLAPDLSTRISQSWFHFIDLTKISGATTNTSSLVLGVVSLAIVAWLTAYAFAWVYNKITR